MPQQFFVPAADSTSPAVVQSRQIYQRIRPAMLLAAPREAPATLEVAAQQRQAVDDAANQTTPPATGVSPWIWAGGGLLVAGVGFLLWRKYRGKR